MFDLQLYLWLSVIPPLLAIGIAVIFRQVYIALIIGLWSGTVILANGNPVQALADTIDHVNTQLPYALNAGTGAAVMFLLAGILYG